MCYGGYGGADKPTLEGVLGMILLVVLGMVMVFGIYLITTDSTCQCKKGCDNAEQRVSEDVKKR